MLSMSRSLAPRSHLMCIVSITRLMLGVHQPDPPGLIHDDPRLLPPWRGSSLLSSFRPVSTGCGITFSGHRLFAQALIGCCLLFAQALPLACANPSDRVLSACTRGPRVRNGRVNATVHRACENID